MSRAALLLFAPRVRRTTLSEAALVETHRRGLEKATAVCAVHEGAAWLTGLVDSHRADAVRILDCAQAAAPRRTLGQAVMSGGSPVLDDWLATQVQRLKQEGPPQVLADLRAVQVSHPDVETLRDHLA